MTMLLRGIALDLSWLMAMVWAVVPTVILFVACSVQWKRLVRHWSSLAHHTICEDCGYILDGVECERCPECGSQLAERTEPASFGRNILLR